MRHPIGAAQNHPISPVPSEEESRLDDLARRLGAAFRDASPESVRGVVVAAWSSFASSKIRDFVPVLVERTARTQRRVTPM